MNPIYVRRRRSDIVIRALCFAAAAFGVTWLALILFFITFIVLAIARYMLLRLQQRAR